MAPPRFTLKELGTISEYITDITSIERFVFVSKLCKKTFDTKETTILPQVDTHVMTPIELTVNRTMQLLKVLKYFPSAKCLQCDTDTIRIIPEGVFPHYSQIEINESEEPLLVKEQMLLIKTLAPKITSLSLKIDEDSNDFPDEMDFAEMTQLRYLSVLFSQNEVIDFPQKEEEQQTFCFSKLYELRDVPTLQTLSVSCEQTTAILLAPIFRELQCVVNVILLYSEDDVDKVREVMPNNVIVCCEYDSTMCEYTRRQTVIMEHDGLSAKMETLGEMHLFEELMEDSLTRKLVLYETIPKWMKVVDLTTYTHIQELQIEGKVPVTQVNIPTSVSSLKLLTNGYCITNLQDANLEELRLDGCDVNPNVFATQPLRAMELKGCNIKTTFLLPNTLTRFSITDSDIQVQLNDGLIELEVGNYSKSSSLVLPQSLEVLSIESNVSMLSAVRLKHLDISKMVVNTDLYPTSLTSLRVLMGVGRKQIDLLRFQKLERLSIIVCDMVKRIVLPHSLKYLMVYGCKEIIAFDNMKNGNLSELCVTECNNLRLKIPKSVKRCFVDIPSSACVKY
ncbi:hypothetical protein EIN_227680 [Entamoeba invadens IP1]|uniref:Leucine-rich repeat containing protein n=1 Tax=Entamoeba invadens IP1 TaxID=370355 RepID=A0A0A1U634_ENTIV|nr:hypothetical protein EIN_227680 [Entamoeba invadens IP1]ELP88345.1 hypothetical protein EIN_227680 [Entamoeba invadens IP1]|eukprot:XP_004255116.1 hypothetical protein EIN_227680 [Entamoeba invadens IP1]